MSPDLKAWPRLRENPSTSPSIQHRPPFPSPPPSALDLLEHRSRQFQIRQITPRFPVKPFLPDSPTQDTLPQWICSRHVSPLPGHIWSQIPWPWHFWSHLQILQIPHVSCSDSPDSPSDPPREGGFGESGESRCPVPGTRVPRARPPRPCDEANARAAPGRGSTHAEIRGWTQRHALNPLPLPQQTRLLRVQYIRYVVQGQQWWIERDPDAGGAVARRRGRWVMVTGYWYPPARPPKRLVTHRPPLSPSPSPRLRLTVPTPASALPLLPWRAGLQTRQGGPKNARVRPP